jgi:hypothetical protein
MYKLEPHESTQLTAGSCVKSLNLWIDPVKNHGFQFEKRSQLFIRVRDEPAANLVGADFRAAFSPNQHISHICGNWKHKPKPHRRRKLVRREKACI